MRPDRLLLVTGNAHKLREVAEILTLFGLQSTCPLRSVACRMWSKMPIPLLAMRLWRSQALVLTGRWCLADDSALKLGRWTVVPASTQRALLASPAMMRRIMQKCAKNWRHILIATSSIVALSRLCRPNAEPLTWQGTMPGEWVMDPRGNGGFGYDPYVLQPDLGLTVAEMSAEAKHARSHRGAALRDFVAWWSSNADFLRLANQITQAGTVVPSKTGLLIFRQSSFFAV